MKNAGLIAQGLTESLCRPEFRRLDNILIDLNQKNMRLQDTKVIGFLYRGNYFYPNIDGMRGGIGSKPVLHEDIYQEMEEYLNERNQVKSEFTLIRQLLSKALEACLTLQDMRDTLPDFLVELNDELFKEKLSNISRYAEVGCSLEGHRLHKKYLATITTMEFLYGARLLY